LSPPPSLPAGPSLLGTGVPTVGDGAIAPVYAIRNPRDLERLEALTPQRSVQPLGEYLLARGLITADDLAEVLSSQRTTKERRIGWILKTLGILEPDVLNLSLAAHSGTPCVYLGNYKAEADYEDLLPKEFARENGMVLLHDSPEAAWLAIADLTQRAGYREVVTDKFGKRVALLHATQRDLIKYLERDTPPRTVDKASRLQKEAEEARRRYLLAAGLPADSPTKRDS
jgi:hypothetical protein